MITTIDGWKRFSSTKRLDNIKVETVSERIAGDKDLTIYQIKCKDPEGSLKSLIEYIAKNGNTGHSFSIVVDPKDENEKTFGWDGDGGDYIREVEIVQEPVKESVDDGYYERLVSEVNRLMSSVEEKYGIDLWIYPTKSSAKTLILSKIVLPKGERGNGKGTKTMEEVTKFADDRGLQILLTPSKDFGGSVSRLKEFYRSFGFKPYKGYDFRESMIRPANESKEQDSDAIMLSLTKGEEPKKLNGKDWVVDKIIDVIQDPKDIAKYEASAGISTDLTYKTVATGDVLWLTALLKPRNRNTTTSAGEMGVIKVKVMNVYYGLNKITQLQKQGRL